jgi:AhpD family alkylhydroperoxidase
MGEKVNVGAQLGKLGKEMPGIMGGFGKFSAEVLKDGVLSTRTKELIAVALAVGPTCEYCIRFRVPKAVEAGANRAEILEATGVSMLMAGGLAAAYTAVALLEVLDEVKRKIKNHSFKQSDYFKRLLGLLYLNIFTAIQGAFMLINNCFIFLLSFSSKK